MKSVTHDQIRLPADAPRTWRARGATMRAVIPAAGSGTRLGALTADRPKPLVEVAGEPLLAHVLRALAPLVPTGLEEAVVVVGPDPDGERIRARFGERFEGIPLSYARQERPEGLARAVLAAAERLEGALPGEPSAGGSTPAPEARARPCGLVVMNGDNVMRANVEAPVARFRERELDALVVTERVRPERARQGVCLTDDRGRLERLVEHPGPEERRAGRIVTGFHVFSPRILEACRRVEPSEEGEYELTDAVNRLLAEGAAVETMELDGWRVNVNAPEDLARAERRLAAEGPDDG